MFLSTDGMDPAVPTTLYLVGTGIESQIFELHGG